MTRPPVAVFAYNRPAHLKATLEALRNNYGADESSLYIFSDGAKVDEEVAIIAEVRSVIKNFDTGFKTVEIFESENNRGLADSIISGVTEIVSIHEKVVVIEDDIITAPQTLDYFNQTLNHFEHNTSVFSISAYSHPPEIMELPESYEYDVYCIPRMMCWGWATWADRWKVADWKVSDFPTFLHSSSLQKSYCKYIGRDSLETLKRCVADEKDVWACRWVYTHFMHHALCVCPVKSFIDNIGLDSTGVNCGTDQKLKNRLDGYYPSRLRMPEYAFVDPDILDIFMNVYDGRLCKSKLLKGPIIPLIKQHIKTLLTRTSEKLFNLLSIKEAIQYERLGTDYGGWKIVPQLLKDGSCVISAGAGEDISFDLSMASRYRSRIYIMDPTPRAIKHFQETRNLISSGKSAPINNSNEVFYHADKNDVQRITFHPVGLWSKNEKVKFYVPKEKAHVSHSINNLHGTSSYFEADCFSLQSFAQEHQITDIEVLKLDIEGAEFAVLRSLFNTPHIRPKQLLVEFHPGKSRLEKAMKIKALLYSTMLWLMGYRLLSMDDWDFVFIHKSSAFKSAQGTHT